MINFFIILGIIILICFTFVCFLGAPYVPTRKKWAIDALDLVKLDSEDLVIDLGSGSGAILKIISKRSIPVIGYELNPILWFISKLRFIFSKNTKVKLVNFWKENLPDKTSVVYVFALDRDAKKLEEYFEEQSKNRSIKVITFGFKLPNKKEKKHTKGAFLYYF